jgi:hypothetical protein
MDLKRLISYVSYRIEEKPGGGFIARPYDSDSAPLEAPTRFELNKLIQARNAEVLAREFPDFKLSAQEQEHYSSFHIERRPDGGFTVHSTDPNAASSETNSHEELESRLAEKALNFMAKRLADKLPPEIAAQLNSGDVKVAITRTSKTSFGKVKSEMAVSPPGQTASPMNSAVIASSELTNSQGVAGFSGASPITPEPSGSWAILRFLLAALVVLGLIYLFLHRR